MCVCTFKYVGMYLYACKHVKHTQSSHMHVCKYNTETHKQSHTRLLCVRLKKAV